MSTLSYSAIISERSMSGREPSNVPGVRSKFVVRNLSFWYGLFLPKGTPAAIVQKLNAAILAVMNMPAVQKWMTENGADLATPERRSPDYLQKFVESEIEKWAGPIKASGQTVE